MKHYIFLIALSFFTIACNTEVKETERELSSMVSDSVRKELKIQSDSMEAAEKAERILYDEVYAQKGFDLMEKETIGQLQLDMTLEAVKAILGEPEWKGEWQLWGSDGYEHQEQLYQNEDIWLGFIKEDDGRILLDRMSIEGNVKFKTSRGIGLGDHIDKVIKAYEAEIYNTDDTIPLIAGTIYGGVMFSFEKDILTDIYIGDAAE